MRGSGLTAFAAATAALGPGRRYTSLVPTQLRRILDAEGAAAALRSYAAVLVGGAALDPATRERALAAGVRVVTTYGMSETAGGCVYDGVPLDGVTVELDPDGRILLGGPTLASGYLRPDGDGARARGGGAGSAVGIGGPGGDAGGGDPGGSDAGSGRTAERAATAGGGEAGGGNAGGGDAGATRAATQAATRPRGDAGGDRAAPARTAAGTGAGSAFADGRFRTGDLGRWRDGRLEVLGRADDVIVTGGEKVAPAAVERVLAAQPGVRAACVVGLPDAEWGQVVAAAVVWEAPDGGRSAPGSRADRARASGAVPRLLVAVRRDPPAWDRQARSGGRRTPRERRRRTASPGSVSPPRPRSGGITLRALTPATPSDVLRLTRHRRHIQEARPCGRCCPCWPPPS